MFLSWMGERALKPTDAHSSRNLITIIPSEFYLTVNKVNKTLQEAMRVVTSNMNKFFREGTCGLRALVSTLKGDWKFMKQIMNLAHYATSNKVCWMCDATKSLENPLTNISASASWRDKIWLVDPWGTKPAIANLERWTITVARMVLGSGPGPGRCCDGPPTGIHVLARSIPQAEVAGCKSSLACVGQGEQEAAASPLSIQERQLEP